MRFACKAKEAQSAAGPKGRERDSKQFFTRRRFERGKGQPPGHVQTTSTPCPTHAGSPQPRIAGHCNGGDAAPRRRGRRGRSNRGCKRHRLDSTRRRARKGQRGKRPYELDRRSGERQGGTHACAHTLTYQYARSGLINTTGTGGGRSGGGDAAQHAVRTLAASYPMH